MKKLTETMKQMLDALAFAHAGEYLSGREKTRILAQNKDSINQAPAAPEVPKARKSNNARHVALYLGSELPSEVMEYVTQTCASLKHDLTVLTFQSENTARALLDPYMPALVAANVEMELVTLSGDPLAGLGRYLRSHPEVAFLACKEAGYLGRSYLNGTQAKNALPVPVVVVTTSGESSAAPEQPAASAKKDSGAEVA